MALDETPRNVVVSVCCGCIFGFAWWLLIDVFAYYPEAFDYKHGVLIVPAVLSTISLIGNNLIPNASLVENFTVTRTIFCHRTLFFFTMAFGFAGVLTAIILSSIIREPKFPVYARVGVPVMNVLILTSNLLFKFLTTDGSENAF